jgi:hypothetical protein
MSREYSDFIKYKQEQLNSNNSKYLGYNNKYEMPPHMNDGRIMSNSWQPGVENNVDIIKSNNITTSWEYRQFMTKNANIIRSYNFNEACNEMNCNNKTPEFPINSNEVKEEYSTPYRYISNNDNNEPKGYTISDLKSAYLSREELASRKVANAITQEELLRNPR